MRKSKYEAPLTVEEQAFATENHDLIKKYLNIRQLPYDEWYDAVITAIPNFDKEIFKQITGIDVDAD